MITHVKRNAQRVAYTKPSYIECAVQFRNQTPFSTQSFNCKNVRKSLYSRRRDAEIDVTNEFIMRMEKNYLYNALLRRAGESYDA